MQDKHIVALVAAACVIAIGVVVGITVFGPSEPPKSSVSLAPTAKRDDVLRHPNSLAGNARPATVVSAAPPPRLTPELVSQTLQGDVRLQIEDDVVAGKPYVIMGSSNLPIGTKLVVSLTRPGPRGLIGQDKLEIGGDGRFASRGIGPTSGLEPGDYTASVVVPIPSVHPASVRAIIGERGENLRGPLVENSQYGVTVKAVKVFKVGARGDAAFTGTLHDGAGRGNVEAVRMFIKQGADLNQPDSSGSTPLHLAVEWGHVDVVALLVGGGANVDAENNMGNTALHLAATEGHVNTAKMLLAKGAKVDPPNKDGETPLKWAVATGHVDVVALLLKSGAKADSKDRFGKTPLFWPTSALCAELLLTSKADANAKNHLGETPLQQAALDGRKEVVLLLLNHGADINAADRAGNTALKWALRQKHDEVAQLLRQNGARE